MRQLQYRKPKIRSMVLTDETGIPRLYKEVVIIPLTKGGEVRPIPLDVLKPEIANLLRNATLDQLKEMYNRYRHAVRKHAYSVCYPSIIEVLNGEIEEDRYASTMCADYARDFLADTRDYILEPLLRR